MMTLASFSSFSCEMVMVVLWAASTSCSTEILEVWAIDLWRIGGWLMYCRIKYTAVINFSGTYNNIIIKIKFHIYTLNECKRITDRQLCCQRHSTSVHKKLLTHEHIMHFCRTMIYSVIHTLVDLMEWKYIIFCSFVREISILYTTICHRSLCQCKFLWCQFLQKLKSIILHTSHSIITL